MREEASILHHMKIKTSFEKKKREEHKQLRKPNSQSFTLFPFSMTPNITYQHQMEN